MIRKESRNETRLMRHKRVRKNISGTKEMPRLNVFRSNNGIYAQVIDDVNGVTLASSSSKVKELGLNNYVLLGRGQEKYKTQDEKLYSSIYEALVAGIYLDGGMAKAKKFIKKTIIANYLKDQKQNNKKIIKADGKNAFQEYVQKRHLGYVSYQTLSKTGPDHLPEFRVVAMLNGLRIAEGKGLSKKEAEACAALNALSKLKQQDGE